MDVFRDNGLINKITLYGGFVKGKRLSWTVEDERDIKRNGVRAFIDFYYDILDLGELKTIAKEMAEGKFKRKSWHVLPDDYKPIDEIAVSFDLPTREKKTAIKEIANVIITVSILFILASFPIAYIDGSDLAWDVFLYSVICLMFAGIIYCLSCLMGTFTDEDVAKKSPYDFLNTMEERLPDGKTKDSKIDVSKIKATRYCSYCGVKLPKSVGECPYCGKFDDAIYNSKLFWRKARKERKSVSRKVRM